MTTEQSIAGIIGYLLDQQWKIVPLIQALLIVMIVNNVIKCPMLVIKLIKRIKVINIF